MSASDQCSGVNPVFGLSPSSDGVSSGTLTPAQIRLRLKEP